MARGGSMQLEFDLKVFKGPLDLLLHLIEKNKIDIYDIPIPEVTDQSLEAIKGIETKQMDELSEFLVMAATLLELKTRMLLPVEEEKEEQEDPAKELAKRLIEYKLFKEIAKNLQEMEKEATKHYYKNETLPTEVLEYQEPVDLDELLSGLDLTRLHHIFERLIAKERERKDEIRGDFSKIPRDSIKISDKIEQILEKCSYRKRFYFGSLLNNCFDRLEIVVTFLAMLELMKSGQIRVKQENILDDIYIEKVDKT